jgi:exopolysaccharide biosynthesis polyprenyl glycosylphosphotransferase
MIAYRQRGFVNFYTFVTSGFTLALLFAYAAALPWIPWVDLSYNVNLLSYALAALVGILAGGRAMRPYAHRLHALHGSETLSLAFMQSAYVGGAIFALMFATKDREVSRLFLGSYLLLLGCGLTLIHGRFPKYFARVLFSDNTQARTLFVGRATTPENLLPWVQARQHLGIQPAGYLADVSSKGMVVPDLPHLGSPADLEKVLKERRINQVILLDWLDDPAEMERLVAVCEAEGCRFLIHNSFATKFARNLIGVEEGGEHFFAVQEEPLEDPTNRALKRLLDIAVSLPVVVLILPPLTLGVWLGQRLQAPGPVFFNRPRGGQQRREFPMLKYRSMYVDNPDVAKQATARDDRIFPFGRFLRKTSLDEMPQFLNVLKGEMSVVGPRPHLPQHDEAFSKLDRTYRVRSLVKPGITGLAQIRGYRGEITEPEKLRQRVYWDLYYVTNWTIWMDVRIILRTAWQVVFPPKTAY